MWRKFHRGTLVTNYSVCLIVLTADETIIIVPKWLLFQRVDDTSMEYLEIDDT